MKNLTYLNEYRLKNACLIAISFYGGDPKYNGVFRIRLKNFRYFTIIATNGGGWDHVSVSPYKGNQTPTWEEMCEIKDLFFEPEEEVVQFHPKKSEYINIAKTCLHMWRPNDGCEIRNPIREAKPHTQEAMNAFMKRLQEEPER